MFRWYRIVCRNDDICLQNQLRITLSSKMIFFCELNECLRDLSRKFDIIPFGSTSFRNIPLWRWARWTTGFCINMKSQFREKYPHMSCANTRRNKGSIFGSLWWTYQPRIWQFFTYSILFHRYWIVWNDWIKWVCIFTDLDQITSSLVKICFCDILKPVFSQTNCQNS